MPKVLIMSHNPLTTYEGMGKTFMTLFSLFSKEEICQLYIYPTVPNIDKCHSYFRITDKDVLRSYYKFHVHGEEIQPDTTQSQMFEKEGDEQLYRNPRNKRPIMMLMRDAMWKCSHWYTKELQDWLDKENPDCIFAAPGTAMFFYDMAMSIAKKRQIPLLSYLCDEYYFVNVGGSALNKLRIRLLQKKIEQYLSKTAHVITICDELKDLYSHKFHRPMTTIMTGSSFPIAAEISHKDHPTTISFLGNVRCNRFRPLTELAYALDEMNEEEGTNYKLKVYSSEKNEDILNVLRQPKSLELCDFVSGDAFKETLHNADFLLHTEAFDEGSINLVRNSISTKIADSLGSGVPLIAYGPAEVASMGHLLRNHCAIAITKPEDLKPILKKAFTDQAFREGIAQKGLETAHLYHEPQTCGENVRKVFQDTTGKL